MNNKYWVYWPEQCKYYINRNCDYKDKVKEYITNLNSVNNLGVYGSLSWWCDYYIFNEEEYLKNSLGEGYIKHE